MADDGTLDPTTSPGLTPVPAGAASPDGLGAAPTGADTERTRRRLALPGGGHRPLRRRRWPRRILLLANLVVFVVIAGAATVVGYTSYELNAIHRVKVSGLTPYVASPANRPKSKAMAPFTMLIVGSDTRALKGSVGVNIGNTTTNPETLSDSIILARVDPGAHKLALLSIPRDLFVTIPGIGEAKINAAFSGRDPARLIGVITNDLGIPVNHYAAVNFYSFEQIANAIGGVPQYFPSPAFDIESGLQVPKAGCVNLRGAQALGFVRSRNYFYVLDGVSHLQLAPESDLGRIQRQQAFIKSAIKKAERTGDLTNPVTLARLIGSLTTNLSVDTQFSDTDLISLAEAFRNVNTNDIPNLTYPVVNSGSGLARVPVADAAVVAKFTNLGATTPKPTTSTTHKATATTGAVTATTAAPVTTTTLPAYGDAYNSGTQISAASSSFYQGVYIPPGRVPGQQVQTCGN